MRIQEPVTTKDFFDYYQLRWEVLRKPWNQPKGSEKDDAEESSIHVMAINDSGVCVGVSRLQFNNTSEGQIRFMAVLEGQQGKGIGKKLMKFLEEKAKENSISKIILQARENAVPFYLSIGYELKEKTFLLFDSIQHFKMEKQI